MKSLSLAALALLPAALSASPSLSVDFSIFPTAVDADTYGLNGSEIQFSLYYFDETYSTVAVGENYPGLNYVVAELNIIGDSSLAGFYNFYPNEGELVGAFVPEAPEGGIFAAVINPVSEGAAIFQLDTAAFLTVTAPIWLTPRTPTVGDTINQSDFTFLMPYPIIPQNLAISMDGDPNGGVQYTYSFAPTTAVPEPSTYAALAGLGVLGFVALRRRK